METKAKTSSKKSLKVRFEGKTIIMADGMQCIVTEVKPVGKVSEGFVIIHHKGKKIELAEENIETKGNKYFQKEEVKVSGVKKTDVVAAATAAVAPALVTEKLAPAPKVTLEDEEVMEEFDAGEESFLGTPVYRKGEEQPEEVLLTCQFCVHTFNTLDEGFEKPQEVADVCPNCISLAEARLLGAGVPGHEVTPELVTEFLARFYGMVRSDLAINVSEIISLTDKQEQAVEKAVEHAIGDLCEVPVQPVATPIFESCSDAFTYARRSIAKTLVEIISPLDSEAQILQETEDSIILRFNTFDFELGSLCGGFILSPSDEEECGFVKDTDFMALDELYSYFCEEAEAAAEAEAEAIATAAGDEDLEDLEEDDEDELLPIGTFYRMQNCKKEENNKKLVKLIDLIPNEDPEAQVVYRVQDKTGKTYKVTESKLKPSVKSF
jgi:hypothetical protein